MSQFNDAPTPDNQSLPTSGKAIASLVLGIVSIPTCLFYGIPAIICGVLAIIFNKLANAQIQAGESNPQSAGLAKAGLICGIIGLVLGIIYLIFMVVFIIFMVANS